MKQFCTIKSGWLMALLLISSGAFAQFTVSGTVTDDNGETLIGVTVVEKGTSNGSVTDLDGNYSVEVSGESATLVFSFIGYKETEVEVSSSKTTVDVQMEYRAAELDEVIVSGLATSVKRSNAASSVATITAEQLTGITTQQTMDGALYGKFTGAEVISNSGAPGGGFNIKMRGITSIEAGAQPLYIIDGVYIDNSSISAGLNVVSNAAGGGSANPFDQDNPSNRVADIDPNDIETIEILKGASAAAIYGSRAAAGVVIITTKKGKNAPKGEKTLNVNFGQTVGMTQMINPLGVRDWDVDKVNAAFGVDTITGVGFQEEAFLEAQENGELQDYEDQLYGNTGMLSTSRLSVAGGNYKTSFFAGATVQRDEGIVENTGYDKNAFRLNVNHTAGTWLDLGFTSNYIQSSADRGFFNNDNSGTTMGISLLSTPPWAQLGADEDGNYPDNPFGASNFLQTRDEITNNEKVNRVISGASATARLFSNDNHSLKLILRGGIDFYNLNTTAIFPTTLQFQSGGSGTNGASIQGNTNVRNNNTAAFLVHTWNSDGGLTLRTQLGATREAFDRNTIITTATEMIGSQTNVDQAGSVSVYQNRILQEDMGMFVQEEVNFKDMIIATIGVRADKSSNNGDVNKLFYYPKANLAFNIHELGFWSDDNPMTQMKLRVAYGESGNFAKFGSKFTSLNGVIIDGTAGSLISQTQGNDLIEPERQTEIEAGFDIGFLDGRVSADITYYRKLVKDLLLEAEVPTSSGFQEQIQNAADLQNQGVEIGVNADILRTADFKWHSRTSFWLNRSEITRLDVPAFNTGAFGATLGTYRIEEGMSATQIVGITSDTSDADGIVVYGDAEADFQMSFQNSLQWKGLELSFVLHWKQGGDNINLTSLLSDIFQTSFDYDGTDLDPDGVLSNGDYRLSQLGVSAAPWVQDAGYVRLRELGLFYNIPRDKLKKAFKNSVQSIRVGVSGYNLLSFFSYNSYDPEVSNFVARGVSSGVEVAPFPTSKRFYFHFDIGF